MLGYRDVNQSYLQRQLYKIANKVHKSSLVLGLSVAPVKQAAPLDRAARNIRPELIWHSSKTFMGKISSKQPVSDT